MTLVLTPPELACRNIVSFAPGRPSRQLRCKSGATPVQLRSLSGFRPDLQRGRKRFGPDPARTESIKAKANSVGEEGLGRRGQRVCRLFTPKAIERSGNT